jgi:N utilization substance protein B
MGKRREARELAVQYFYQLDLAPESAGPKSLENFWKLTEPSEIARKFAEDLITGMQAQSKELDRLIDLYSKNWKLNRMAVVDRNIIRLALFEMHFRKDIPPVVSINEAVEIAKRFSTDDSGKFVNGLLDRARQDLTRPARKVEKE